MNGANKEMFQSKVKDKKMVFIEPQSQIEQEEWLDKLIEEERIHKNSIKKTFVLCNHDHEEDHNTALAICKKCGDTEELKSNVFTEILKKKSLKNYDLNDFSMQIITTCKGCN